MTHERIQSQRGVRFTRDPPWGNLKGDTHIGENVVKNKKSWGKECSQQTREERSDTTLFLEKHLSYVLGRGGPFLEKKKAFCVYLKKNLNAEWL